MLVGAISCASALEATNPDPVDQSIQHFLAQDDTVPAYRATRRLEAVNGDKRAWLDAVTEYSPQTGFNYDITDEGGTGLLRSKVLHAVLDGEREAIAKGEAARSSLANANYAFQPDGMDADGLASVRLMPRRKERALVSGHMLLHAGDGCLVRLEGHLAKSPSFWVKDVEIVRTYERVGGAVMPVALESHAQVRLVGEVSLRMTYAYTQVDGHATRNSGGAQALTP
jgi:hypothetical protein